MATDIFSLLVDIFKINQNLVSEYALQGSFYQLFYLFVFPAILIIVFIWILTNWIMGPHKGLRLLLSVGVYAFIILQGYYSYFVMLSKYWFFGLLILGFFYLIAYRGGSKGGGGGGGAAHGMAAGNAVSRLENRVMKKITGQEKQLTQRIESHLKQLENKGSLSADSYARLYINAEDDLRILEQMVRDTDPTGHGFAIFGEKYKNLHERFLRLADPINLKKR